MPGPRVVYTDGSAAEKPFGRGDVYQRKQYLTGWAYLTSDGAWGLGGYPQHATVVGSDRAVVAELRAVYNASVDLADEELLIRLDSQYARRLLADWAKGDRDMPAGYVGSQTGTSTLENLRLSVLHLPDRITTEHVPGHSGDPLNSGADLLARLGIRWMRERMTVEGIRPIAERLARVYLGDAGAQGRTP